MTTIQTPLRLNILLGCYLNSESIQSIGTSAGDDELANLVLLGAVEMTGVANYRTTPLGDAWVKTILNTPIPRMCFVDQHGKEIL